MTDREIPERTVSYYEGPLRVPVLRRNLSAEERAALETRAAHLRTALAPFTAGSKKTIGNAISEMLRGFPQMQRRTVSEAAGILDGYAATLAERPAWAIVDACALVRAGKVAAHVNWPPSEGALNQLVAEVIAPYRARLQAAERLLGAKP